MSDYGDPDRIDAAADELATAVARVEPVSVVVQWQGGAADAFAARAAGWRRDCAAVEPSVAAVVAALRAHADAMRVALARIAANEWAARAGPAAEVEGRFPAGGSAAGPAERWAAR